MTAHRDPDRFGLMPDGSPVWSVRLGDGAFHVDVMTFGAALRDIGMDGRSLVLGCATLDQYIAQSPHFGAVLGRFANRIARGHLVIDGETYQLTLNNGRNHMHGGAPGFSRRNWMLLDHTEESATLAIVAPDGEQGYPGEVRATCRYTLVAPRTLEMVLDATTDRATVVNLANHSYFNLDGASDVSGHEVEIFADRYLPLDDENIPTGVIAAVTGTRFDFRRPRVLGTERFDTPFVIADAPTESLRPVARVRAAAAGVTLEVASTQPSVQFYTGGNIKPGIPARDGGTYGPGAGLCFETQGFPDAPNHPNFPSVLLRPGERYRQITRYTFAQSQCRPERVRDRHVAGP